MKSCGYSSRTNTNKFNTLWNVLPGEVLKDFLNLFEKRSDNGNIFYSLFLYKINKKLENMLRILSIVVSVVCVIKIFCDRFEIKKKLKTAKKKEKEEKKKKQEEEQEKRKLSQVQDTQVVSLWMF